MQLGGARFDPRQHGPFKYGYVANFLGQMVAGRLAQLGKTPKEVRTTRRPYLIESACIGLPPG